MREREKETYLSGELHTFPKVFLYSACKCAVIFLWNCKGLIVKFRSENGYRAICKITVTSITTFSLRKDKLRGRFSCVSCEDGILPEEVVPGYSWLCGHSLLCSLPPSCVLSFWLQVDLLPCQFVHSVNPFILLLGCTLA